MTVLKEGITMAQLGWTMGVMTVVFMGAMIAWIAWVWSPSQRTAMDEAANLPLEDD
ncbi:MAG: cbb3-type cytochrome oxidase subunit 3 [Myxococcota bacterium]|jgi:cbb3-type cytochrome oxidase subunit 3